MKNSRSEMCVPIWICLQARGAIYIDSLEKPHGFQKNEMILIKDIIVRAFLSINHLPLNESLMISKKAKMLNDYLKISVYGDLLNIGMPDKSGKGNSFRLWLNNKTHLPTSLLLISKLKAKKLSAFTFDPILTH